MKQKFGNSGFTLIELLVVISIIGLMASIVLVNVNSARKKARDARRKGDLHQLQTALELYNNDYGEYPNWGSPMILINFSNWNNDPSAVPPGNKWCLVGSYPCSLADALVTTGKYLLKLPVDPINRESFPWDYLAGGPSYDNSYVYFTTGPNQYLLGTNLEEGAADPASIYPDHPEFGNYQIRVGF